MVALQPDILVTIFTGKGRYFPPVPTSGSFARLPADVEKANPNTAEGKAIIGDYYIARAHAGQGKLALALRNHPKI